MNIRIYALYQEKTHQIISVAQEGFPDPSLYISLVRENELTSGFTGKFNPLTGQITREKEVKNIDKIVRISYHASGVINYHNLSVDRVYGEPLHDINKTFCFEQYIIKDLNKLPKKTKKPDDIILDLPSKEDNQYFNLQLFISPKPLDGHACIEFSSGLFYLILHISVIDIIDEKSMPFYYLTPSNGLANKPASGNGTILYHQKINKTSKIIIYPPNSSGICTMVYHTNRIKKPLQETLITFKNPNHEAKFTTVKTNYAKFEIRNRKTGEQITNKSGFIISKILFDCRL